MHYSIYKPNLWLGTFKLIDNISIYFYLTYKSHCKFGLFGLFHIVDKTLTVKDARAVSFRSELFTSYI